MTGFHFVFCLFSTISIATSMHCKWANIIFRIGLHWASIRSVHRRHGSMRRRRNFSVCLTCCVHFMNFHDLSRRWIPFLYTHRISFVICDCELILNIFCFLCLTKWQIVREIECLIIGSAVENHYAWLTSDALRGIFFLAEFLFYCFQFSFLSVISAEGNRKQRFGMHHQRHQSKSRNEKSLFGFFFSLSRICLSVGSYARTCAFSTMFHPFFRL